MRLRFIGANGTMGLYNNKTYEVSVKKYEYYIILIVKIEHLEVIVFGYSSPQALANDWSL